MPLKAGARIQETSTTTGIGTYALDGAPVGSQSFSVLGAGNPCTYFATDGTSWEEGIGTVLIGPNRLERTHVLASSNAGAAVNWAVGTRTIVHGPIGALAVPRKLAKDVSGAAGTTVLTQDEQRYNIIDLIGALTGDRVLELDATPWNWIVYNNTTGAFTLAVRVTGQAGVLVPQGKRAALYCDGTDVRFGAPMASPTGSEFAAGTAMLFAQTAAPTGWTKSTTHNDKALRVVSGVAGSGGATAFTSVFGAGKLTGAHTLTTAEIPSHGHGVNDPSHSHGENVSDVNNTQTPAYRLPTSANGVDPSILSSGTGDTFSSPLTTAASLAGISIAGTGGGGAHDHTLSLDLQYVDAIIAIKD